MAQTDLEHKPVVRSKIAKLPAAQRQQIRYWMSEGLTYTEIQRRVLETFGTSLSQNSLSDYYSKHSRDIINNSRASESTEPLHLTLVLHVQIRPELLQPASSDKSDGN